MLKKIIGCIVIISLSTGSCFSQDNPLPDFISRNKDKSPGQFTTVTTNQLISKPEDYDGKVVRVVGYLNLEFEGTALYTSKSDDDKHYYKNSIWLSISKKHRYELDMYCSEKYASVIGTFKQGWNGHFGMFSGTITEIRRIDLRKN